MTKVLGTLFGHERTLPLDLVLYRCNETEYVRDAFPKKWGHLIKEMFTVKMFDRNQHIHICSFTPCYELDQIYSDFSLNDGVDISDELRDEIWEWWQDACRFDERFEYNNVHDIEKLMEKYPERFHIYGNPLEGKEDADVEFDDQWEGVREHYVGNPIW